jgi:hypothetical protein
MLNLLYEFVEIYIEEDKVNSKTTLNYLNVDDVMIGNTHNIWCSGGVEPYAVNRSCVKAKLACGTYTLQKDRSKFSNHSATSFLSHLTVGNILLH